MYNSVFIYSQHLRAFCSGVQVLEKDEDLDKHIASDDVLYLLLHSSGDTNILVRLLIRPTCHNQNNQQT
jgi:hypothetical protein